MLSIFQPLPLVFLLSVSLLMLEIRAYPPVPPTYESNDDFRKRVVFAPESFSTAGADGANIIPDLVAESRLVLHPYWH